MAAIKRSQASQRRQPDSFGFKQEQGKEQLGTSGIKVEIQHLIFAILDDPIVSRVFNEAGFSSFDIKLAMVRPLQSFWRYNSYNPRQRRPQSMFLCNLEENLNPSFLPFRFPFSSDSYGDEDFRRIGDVLARKQGRNPLLFGVCAYDALQAFLQAVERSRKNEQDQFLPLEIRGVSVFSLEREILKFVNDNCGEELIKSRFEELAAMMEGCCGTGLLVCFGDLKVLVKDDGVLGVDIASSLVTNFTKFLEVHRDRAWLIGCATYEIYLKFLTRFPSIEKDLDLKPLPITSMKLSKGEMCFKSSLMGSFVPFTGFFPSSDFKGIMGSSYQIARNSDLCNSEHAQAVTAGTGYYSVSDQCQTTLPSWLRMAGNSTSSRSDTLKAKDDAGLLRATTSGCYNKWDNACQNFHNTRTSPSTKIYGDFAKVPPAGGQPSAGEEKLQGDDNSSRNTNASCNESDEKHSDRAFTNTRKNSVPKVDQQGPTELTANNENFLFKPSNRPSKTETRSPVALVTPPASMLGSGVNNGQILPSSGTSIATDLMLGVPSGSHSQEEKESTVSAGKKPLLDFCSAANVGVSDRNTSSRSSVEFTGHVDTNDFKSLFEALVRRINRQEEAVRIISQTISSTRTSSGRLKGSRIRGDVWMKFIGLDIFGMRKTALALAEVVCGSKDNLIHIDLSLENGSGDQHTVFGRKVILAGSDVRARRKTMVDHIADRLSKMPLSVVFLENLHCAHTPTQNSLLHAIRSGKFLDSHGREVGISNAIFVLVSEIKMGNSPYPSNTPDDRIAKAKPWPLQITVTTKETADKTIKIFFNKRKLHITGANKDPAKRPHKGPATCLDLNLPADGNTEADDIDVGIAAFGSCAWLEDLSSQVDVTVAFKPYDYDILAEKISDYIQVCFSKSFCCKCILEIDSVAMDQILAGACWSDRQTEVEDWLDEVLSKALTEARQRYHHASHSVVKIHICRPLHMEEEKPIAWLPSKMILSRQP